MRVICTQENLTKGVSLASRVVGTRSTLPILSHLLLSCEKGQLKIAATDLEIALIVLVGAKVEEEGMVTVPGRLLNDFISANPDNTITLSTEGTKILAASDHVKAHLNGLDASDFPLIPDINKDFTLTIKSGALKEAINQVVLAAALDETRPILTGVLCRVKDKYMTLVATDSYRLAEKTIELEQIASKPFDVVIPARTFQEVNRLIDQVGEIAKLTLTESQIGFNIGNTTLISRVLEGTFPDYLQIIPKEAKTKIICQNNQLSSALKLASSFTRDISNNIRITIKPNQTISINATSSSVGDSTITVDATVSGEELDIAFNARFLLDILGVIAGGEVEITCGGALSAVIIRDNKQINYRALVMPLKLD